MAKQQQIPGTERPVIDAIEDAIETVDDLEEQLNATKVDLDKARLDLESLVSEHSEGHYYSARHRREVEVKDAGTKLRLVKWIPKDEEDAEEGEDETAE